MMLARRRLQCLIYQGVDILPAQKCIGVICVFQNSPRNDRPLSAIFPLLVTTGTTVKSIICQTILQSCFGAVQCDPFYKGPQRIFIWRVLIDHDPCIVIHILKACIEACVHTDRRQAYCPFTISALEQVRQLPYMVISYERGKYRLIAFAIQIPDPFLCPGQCIFCKALIKEVF